MFSIHPRRVRIVVIGLAVLVLMGLGPRAASAGGEVPTLDGETLAGFDAPDAYQGAAVDKEYLYAINNFRITKMKKATGEPVLQWDGSGPDGPIIHLDGGVVVDGRLYCAHSNYPAWPMTSSVEVWEVKDMRHVATHSIGVANGTLTWIDRHDGFWWGTFANYDLVQPGRQLPHGLTRNTQLARMDDNFQVLEAWTYPEELLKRFQGMSCSGGSWGPDGRLYITGHDLPVAYVMELPGAGSILKWVAEVNLPDIAGQGLAWERDGDGPVLYGVRRNANQVVKMRLPLQQGRPRAGDVGVVRGPAEMVK
ncbi:MAG: hypothetical protein V1816_09085 [Pseudomonadota bacterium]